MKYNRLIVVLAVLGALAGCSVAASGPTYTVHGTVAIEYPIDGDAVVMVTEGSNSYSVSVPVLQTDGSWDYSVPGVPAGTYTVSLSYPTDDADFLANYSVNGGVDIPAFVDEIPFTSVTATTGDILIEADLQLDANIWVS